MKFGLKRKGVHLSSVLVSLILAATLIPLAGFAKIDPRFGLSLRGESLHFSMALHSALNSAFIPYAQTDYAQIDVQLTQINAQANLLTNLPTNTQTTLHAKFRGQTIRQNIQNIDKNIHRSSGWIMYKSNTGQFHILLPTVPNRQVKTQLVMGIPLKITTEVSQLEGVTYLIAYTDYPSSLLTRLAYIHSDWKFFLLEAVKEKFLDVIQGDLITQTYANSIKNIGKTMPIDLEIQFQIGQNQYGVSRWIFVKDRLYQLVVLHSSQLHPSRQEFLDSFQSVR